jgi:hypothetical protein
MMDGWMDGWMDSWGLPFAASATATILIHEDGRQCDRAAPIGRTECAREQPVRLFVLSAAMFGKKTDFPLRRRVTAVILLAHEFRVHACRFEQLQAYFKSMNFVIIHDDRVAAESNSSGAGTS